jgi:hypothetical protein
MKKKIRQNIQGVKKWNKVYSVLVKDLKRKKQKYDLKDVRKIASQIYRSDFKNVKFSKLRVKDIKNAYQNIGKQKIEPKKTEKELIPKEWFEPNIDYSQFYQLGEWIGSNGGINTPTGKGMANSYPELPIMIISTTLNFPNKSPKVIKHKQGTTGNYYGSKWQQFVEDYREKFDGERRATIPFYDENTTLYPEFEGQIMVVDGEKFAVFIENVEGEDIDIDEFATEIIPVQDLPTDTSEKPKPPKKVVKPKPKIKSKKAPLPKKKKTTTKKKKEPTKPKRKVGRPKGSKAKVTSQSKLELARLRTRALELLREDFKDGIYSKEEYKQERQKIFDRYKRGGLI